MTTIGDPIPTIPGQVDALALICPGPTTVPALALWLPCTPGCLTCQETQ